MDNKVVMTINVPEPKKLSYGGISFTLVPFLTIAQQAYLINAYLQEYFEGEEESMVERSSYNIMEADITLKSYLLQMLTDIDTESISNDFYMVDDFWTHLYSEISNFTGFLSRLYTYREIVRETKSAGYALPRLLEKAFGLLEQYQELTPEKIEEARKAGLEMVKAMEKSALLTPVKQEKKPRKRPAKR